MCVRLNNGFGVNSCSDLYNINLKMVNQICGDYVPKAQTKVNFLLFDEHKSIFFVSFKDSPRVLYHRPPDDGGWVVAHLLFIIGGHCKHLFLFSKKIMHKRENPKKDYKEIPAITFPTYLTKNTKRTTPPSQPDHPMPIIN